MLQDKLRPYQDDVVNRYNEAITAGVKRILIVAPTGSGKTAIAAHVLDEAIQQGRHGLFLAHRRELVALASRKLAGCDHGILLPGYQPEPQKPLQVASIATVHARAIRGQSIKMPPADIIVVDESHHSRAQSYRDIIDRYPGAIIMGLTATPIRGDGRGLGDIFETMIECPDVAELTRAGYLVPARVFAPSTPDLTGIPISNGDFRLPQLASRMNTKVLVGDIIKHWLHLAERRPTVVFAIGIAHSLSIQAEFLRAGVRAEHVEASTPEAQRDAVSAKLESGEIEVVCNAMVFVEGWDQPKISCMVLARPTRCFGLFRQMAGRILRPYPGKTDALILDHAGSTHVHGFVDDPIEWSLDDQRFITNPKQTARGPLTTCPDCAAIRIPGMPCLECGWAPDIATLELIDAELIELRNRGGMIRKPTTCAAPGCDRPPIAGRGLCHLHYKQLQRDRLYRLFGAPGSGRLKCPQGIARIQDEDIPEKIQKAVIADLAALYAADKVETVVSHEEFRAARQKRESAPDKQKKQTPRKVNVAQGDFEF